MKPAAPRAAWETALASFLAPWRERREVTGALVCGSYVTGDPSPRSDIDVHILLKPSTKWRERGNDIVDGFLIEYFSNPPHRIREYFRHDFSDNDHACATQFATGQIVFDQGGVIAKLKQEARKWIEKPFRKPSRVQMLMGGYGLWDNLDNFRDAVENVEPDLAWQYVHTLTSILRTYSRFNGECFLRFDKAFVGLSGDSLTKKYAQRPFSDTIFARRFAAAMLETDAAKMLPTLEALTRYVHRKMGGFEIDGFRLRSPARDTKNKK